MRRDPFDGEGTCFYGEEIEASLYVLSLSLPK